MLHGLKHLFSRDSKGNDADISPDSLVAISKTSLSFNANSPMVTVDKEVKESFAVTNICKDKITCNVPDLAVADKYTLTVNPKSAKIKPVSHYFHPSFFFFTVLSCVHVFLFVLYQQATQYFEVTLVVHCTTTVEISLPLEVVFKGLSTF